MLFISLLASYVSILLLLVDTSAICLIRFVLRSHAVDNIQIQHEVNATTVMTEAMYIY